MVYKHNYLFIYKLVLGKRIIQIYLFYLFVGWWKTGFCNIAIRPDQICTGTGTGKLLFKVYALFILQNVYIRLLKKDEFPSNPIVCFSFVRSPVSSIKINLES
jgi:hypothetical protein